MSAGHWKVVTDAPQGSDEWLEARRGGIGGSDVGTILGLNPWATPLDVWLAKVEGQDAAGNEAMEWGHRLEPVVRAKFAESRTAWVDEVPGTLAHPDRDWMRASLDGLVNDADGTAVLEIKTTRGSFDSVPPTYIAQVQWQMAVTGLDLAHIAVLSGGSRYSEFTVEVDARFIEDIADYCDWWWSEYVVAGKMPDPDPVRDAPKLPRLWTPQPGLVAEVDLELAERLRAAKAAAAAAKTELDAVVAEIQTAMGEATVAMAGDVKVATWNERKGSTLVDRKRLEADGLLERYSRVGQPTRTFAIDRKWAQG